MLVLLLPFLPPPPSTTGWEDWLCPSLQSSERKIPILETPKEKMDTFLYSVNLQIKDSSSWRPWVIIITFWNNVRVQSLLKAYYSKCRPGTSSVIPLGAGQKCRSPGPTPDLLNQNMHFTRFLGDVYLLKFEKHCLQSIQSTLLSQLNFTEENIPGMGKRFTQSRMY